MNRFMFFLMALCVIAGCSVGLATGHILWSPDVPKWMTYQAETVPFEWVEHGSCSESTEHHFHGLTRTIIKSEELEFRGLSPDGDSLWGWHKEWEETK